VQVSSVFLRRTDHGSVAVVREVCSSLVGLGSGADLLDPVRLLVAEVLGALFLSLAGEVRDEVDVHLLELRNRRDELLERQLEGDEHVHVNRQLAHSRADPNGQIVITTQTALPQGEQHLSQVLGVYPIVGLRLHLDLHGVTHHGNLLNVVSVLP